MSDFPAEGTEAYERLRREANAYHSANKEVWALFERLSLEQSEKGHRHLGVALIWEHIRWEYVVERKESEWKMPNNHRAFYARYFNALHPELHCRCGHGFFKTATQRSTTTPTPKKTEPVREPVTENWGTDKGEKMIVWLYEIVRVWRVALLRAPVHGQVLEQDAPSWFDYWHQEVPGAEFTERLYLSWADWPDGERGRFGCSDDIGLSREQLARARVPAPDLLP